MPVGFDPLPYFPIMDKTSVLSHFVFHHLTCAFSFVNFRVFSDLFILHFDFALALLIHIDWDVNVQWNKSVMDLNIITMSFFIHLSEKKMWTLSYYKLKIFESNPTDSTAKCAFQNTGKTRYFHTKMIVLCKIFNRSKLLKWINWPRCEGYSIR